MSEIKQSQLTKSAISFQMRTMKFITNLVKVIFRLRYSSDTHRKLRSLVVNFYDYYNEHKWTFNSYRITKCRFYNYPRSLVIEIHSLSPGMIIGKQGQCIDSLKEHIQKRFKKTVVIKLEETNPFK